MESTEILQYKLNSLITELKELNKRREYLLGNIAIIQSKLNITNTLSTTDKVKLYQSMFRGRSDVFPRRFETKQGKSGYAPVCLNQWKRQICKKPKVKCSECKNRNFEPLTEEVIYHHLKGHKVGESEEKEFVAGIYPILPDDTCYFLAIDFDKKEWQSDILATIQTCHDLDIEYILERSRSGNGAHLWIFFNDPIPCELSRKLGTLIISRTMENYPELGFDSYDRMFPNQNKLPIGGFGNLIALPLQKKARNNKNSTFIDNNLIPYPDPWKILMDCKKYNKSEIDDLIAKNLNNIIDLPLPVMDENDETPWEQNFNITKKQIIQIKPNSTIKVTVKNQIFFLKEDLTPELQNIIIKIASFQNPEFYRKQAMRLSTWNIPRIITCAENYKDYISVPRGCLDEILHLLTENQVSYKITEELYENTPIDITFKGELYAKQKKAAKEILKFNSGILAASTAFGKTIVALYITSKRKQKTLILVHRKQLQDQ